MNILFILVALVCSIFVVFGVSQAIRSYQARNWERCIGKLLNWDIYNDVGTGEQKTRLMIKAFHYKYVVSGKEYKSETIGFGFPRNSSSSSGQRVLDEILENVPTVTVYYSPDNPQDSVLCVGIKFYHIQKIAMFVLAVIVFLAIAFAPPRGIQAYIINKYAPVAQLDRAPDS